MNTWILLLLLLCCCNGGGSWQNDSCRDTRDRGDCGRGREHSKGPGRDRDCDCGHDHDHDCDRNDSRFEPRFDARPFGGGETCGCEEKND